MEDGSDLNGSVQDDDGWNMLLDWDTCWRKNYVWMARMVCGQGFARVNFPHSGASDAPSNINVSMLPTSIPVQEPSSSLHRKELLSAVRDVMFLTHHMATSEVKHLKYCWNQLGFAVSVCVIHQH
ncbi:hypothetical protein [Escherichia coli]|uniref:hypothetical protein n=1 Tax=Escherichia coli TaxID=562 RepID=UPI003F49A790